MAERLADAFTAGFGTMTFLAFNLLWFGLWIVINIGWIPSIPPFDPFPFGLLTTIVSLEAIFLAIIVLISQNRAARVDDLRQEIDVQIDMITEQEVTKVMHLLALLAKDRGIDLSQDQTLHDMLRPTDLEKIERALERQVNQ